MLLPDRMAVSPLLPWMNGTTVSLDSAKRVTQFHAGKSPTSNGLRYKTVNLYSFSQPTWQRISEKLEQHISAGRVNSYYETVFANMVTDKDLTFEAVVFDKDRWYEIDAPEDIHEAERLFPAMNGRYPLGAVGE